MSLTTEQRMKCQEEMAALERASVRTEYLGWMASLTDEQLEAYYTRSWDTVATNPGMTKDQPKGGGPTAPVYTIQPGEGAKPAYIPVGGITMLDHFATEIVNGILAHQGGLTKQDIINAWNWAEDMLAESNRRLQ